MAWVVSLVGSSLSGRRQQKKKGEKVHHTYIVNIMCTCNNWPGALIDTVPLYIRPPVPILHDIIVRPLSPAHVLNPSRTRHCEPERKETKKKKKHFTNVVIRSDSGPQYWRIKVTPYGHSKQGVNYYETWYLRITSCYNTNTWGHYALTHRGH